MNSAYKSGFISTARHTIIKEIKNATTLGIWTKLKAAANYNTTNARMNGQILILNRGAIVFSIRQMAEELGMARNTLRKHLGWLVRNHFLRLQTGREGTIAWMLNYDDVPKITPVKSEKLITHRVEPRGSNSAHPIRNVLSNSYNRLDTSISVSFVPGTVKTTEYLKSLESFEVAKEIPAHTRALLQSFKENR